MSKKATEFQGKAMSWMYRGKEIFKPLNTGWIDENVACVREWVANIFFYRKGDTTIMIDAGYNYDRLAEKMHWLGIDPQSIRHILITHQDTDHVGAVEADSPGLFRNAKLYIGEIENRYLTGEVRRKVIYHLYKLPQVTINNEKVLLHDGQVLDIDGVRIECFLVPGHTWGHMVYLIDDKYLFTGDTLWFGADGGYSFISSLAEDNKLAVQSLAELERKLRARGLHPYFIIQYGTRLFMSQGMDEKSAEVLSQQYNIIAMVIFCISRFICTFILRYLNAGKLLMILAIFGGIFTLGVIFLQNIFGMYCLVAVSACMSLMFPTIYGIALKGMGDDAKFGAAGLIMAILGGSVLPPLQASIIDLEQIAWLPAVNVSFILPFICFLVIIGYGYRTVKRNW